MILVDTGALLALADRRDAYHVQCREFFRTNREPLMTTYPVLVECVHLMFARIGVTMTLAWGDTLYVQGVGTRSGTWGFCVVCAVPPAPTFLPLSRWRVQLLTGAHKDYSQAHFLRQS